jgi:hypothetical protein
MFSFLFVNINNVHINNFRQWCPYIQHLPAVSLTSLLFNRVLACIYRDKGDNSGGKRVIGRRGMPSVTQ